MAELINSLKERGGKKKRRKKSSQGPTGERLIKKKSD